MTPGARILVVDDEPAIVRFLRASLESQGYIVATAADARTALEMVADTPRISSFSTSGCPTWMASMS